MLAPDIVEAILGGWADQRAMLEKLERPLPAGASHKLAASRRKGIWMGGNVPLGYRVEARKLVVVEPEAALVRRSSPASPPWARR